MDSTKQEKQQYLFSQIIDKGYDAEDFQEYMFELNGQQINLDTWTMKDLKQVVEKYQAQKSEAEKQMSSSLSSPEKKSQLQSISQSRQLEEDEDQSYYLRNKQQTNISSKELRKMEKMQQSGHYLEFNYETKSQNFSQVIDCIQVPPNQLLSKDFQIKISRFQKKQGGLFEQSYVSYIVETPILGKVVDRRYNDFLWLKTTMERMHPGLPVPPIAKKGQYRRYDDKYLNKRRMILEMFLNKLVQIPEIKADQIFQNFLKFNDRVAFQKFKSEHKNEGTIKLSHVKNTKGKLKMAIDPKINNFLVKAQRHMLETQPMIKKIYKEYKQAATYLQNCAVVLKGVGKLTEGLDNIEKIFRKETDLKYCSSNTFTILKETSEKIADILEKQARSFRTELYSCVKYESLTMLSNLEAFDKLKSYKTGYVEAKNSLFRKKDKLFEQGNRAKWGINPVPTGKIQKFEAIKQMLPKQTQDLARLRVKYALRNFQTFEEISRQYSQNHIYMARNLIKYTKTQSQMSSQLMMVWVDAQTQVMGMEQGRSIHDAYIG